MRHNTLVTAALAAYLTVGASLAQNIAPPPAEPDAAKYAHTHHEYTAYEKLIYKNVSSFHKNFNARAFEKNGDLVADNLHDNSNGVQIDGRDAFVKRIQRFTGPFPDIRITDLDTVVDGNTAAIRYVMTGTHKGDLQTPSGVIHATNRSIRVDGTEFFTFNKEGKLVYLVTITRGDQLLQQIEGK
jgi:predicted ester cyclase